MKRPFAPRILLHGKGQLTESAIGYLYNQGCVLIGTDNQGHRLLFGRALRACRAACYGVAVLENLDLKSVPDGRYLLHARSPEDRGRGRRALPGGADFAGCVKRGKNTTTAPQGRRCCYKRHSGSGWRRVCQNVAIYAPASMSSNASRNNPFGPLAEEQKRQRAAENGAAA